MNETGKASAGGAAMNAGAEFGQRLGAFFAVTMLRQFDVAPFIVRRIAVMKVSIPILESYSSCNNYYAPLMIVLLSESYDLLEIAGDIVFLTNPLEFDRFHENWLRGGLSLGRYRVDILSTDSEFDDVMRTVIARGACGIVNPLVDLDGRVIEGARIVALPSRYPAPER